MTILIGGSRDYNDYNNFTVQMNNIISKLNTENIIILSGHCLGVDALGEKYAVEKGYELKLFPADWTRYGRAAGPIRNRTMAEIADLVIAFWDGKSKGTKSLISIAEKLNRPVIIVDL